MIDQSDPLPTDEELKQKDVKLVSEVLDAGFVAMSPEQVGCWLAKSTHQEAKAAFGRLLKRLYPVYDGTKTMGTLNLDQITEITGRLSELYHGLSSNYQKGYEFGYLEAMKKKEVQNNGRFGPDEIALKDAYVLGEKTARIKLVARLRELVTAHGTVDDRTGALVVAANIIEKEEGRSSREDNLLQAVNAIMDKWHEVLSPNGEHTLVKMMTQLRHVSRAYEASGLPLNERKVRS